MATTKKNITTDEAVEAYALFRALYEKVKEQHDEVIKTLFLSCESNKLTEDLVGVSKIEALSEKAKKGAQAKLADDPKQKDKAMVRECWDAWQRKPDRYKGKAAFARDMLDKYENLESQPVIEGWCRMWERKA